MRSLLSDFSKIPKSRIKTETTIYQLGLDSISAVQLANTLRLRTGKKITAADILERPTLAALSELLNDEQQFETDERNPEIDFSRFENQVKSEVCTELNLDLQDVEAIRPCTPLQTGLISQFLRSGTMYLNHVSVLLDRSFEVDTIQKSWKVLMSSNIMLRTGFAPVNHPEHSFVMITHYHPEPTTFIQTGHAHQDISQWRQECTYQIHREIHHPPWRVLLLESKDGPIMHLTILHALYDAHSLRLMLQDLTSFCNTVKTLDHSPIDPLLGTILSGQQSGEDFWKNELGQASINKFPNLTPLRRSDNQTEVVHRLTSKSMTGLERGCREAGITLQAAGQAAWVRILSAYLGEHAVTFGVVLSGRDTTTEAEDTVFPCITTVPVAVENISDGRKLIENIMGYNGRVRRFQYSSMRNIQRWIGRPNETLFDTIFAYQKLSGHKSEDPWTVIEEIATDEVS
jgi:aryl carrier-like protein